MMSLTTARFLLGLFLQGADLPVCNNPARPIANIFFLIGDIGSQNRGKGCTGRASGRKGPREEGGRSAVERGRN